jgi:NAD(P)-dependent dehydrogenase (short-subunit alcohol dehydrogenase family)
VVLDVRDPDQIDAALETMIEALGPRDILVNNAGGVFR